MGPVQFPLFTESSPASLHESHNLYALLCRELGTVFLQPEATEYTPDLSAAEIRGLKQGCSPVKANGTYATHASEMQVQPASTVCPLWPRIYTRVFQNCKVVVP